jgi:hypothetical protein
VYCGSSGRAPALQVRNLEALNSNPNYTKIKKRSPSSLFPHKFMGSKTKCGSIMGLHHMNKPYNAKTENWVDYYKS